MKTEINGRDWSAEFDNLDELVAFTKTDCPEQRGHRSSRSPSYGDDSFYGCSSWDEAVKLAEHGWKKGEDRARQYAGRLFTKIASQMEQPRMFFDVEGLDFDVARVLAGEPEPWLNQYHETVPAPGRIIKVVYNTGKSGGITTDIVLARGAVVAALVMLLEHAGHSVELIARADTESGGYGRHGGGNLKIRQIVTIKRPGQPLNLPEVAFTLAHSAMHRRFFFSVREHSPYQWWTSFVQDGGYGMSGSTPEADRGDIYLDKMLGYEFDWSSPEHAEAWVIRQLAEQGVEVTK